MCYKGHRKKHVIFILSLMISFSAINIWGQKAQPNRNQTELCNLSPQGSGLSEQVSGISGSNGYSSTNGPVENKTKNYPDGTKPLQIISKPKAYYTDIAKQKCVQGQVLLRIVFLANGNIGKIKILEKLEYGLTNKAIEVAKLIKFQPEIRNNKPITVAKKVTYNFYIY